MWNTLNRFTMAVLAAGMLFLSCKPPLAPIKGQEILRITVDPRHTGEFAGFRTVVLTDPGDIAFVVRNLSNLRASADDHTRPIFDLRIETRSGQLLMLRVSAREVGRNAAASAYNIHWFPRDDAAFKAFYDFLYRKTHPAP